MDGTLLDTEKVYFDSLIAALNSCGFTDDVVPLCHAMIGLPGPECEKMVQKRYGGDFCAACLPLKDGAVELLDALQAAACPMAIVTSSSRHSTDQHLTLAGI